MTLAVNINQYRAIKMFGKATGNSYLCNLGELHL